MTIVKTVWLFDVDGVITNPSLKKITVPQIIDEIIKRLENSEPVALVTGRSLEWVEERVLDPLEKRILNKNLLSTIFVSGEFGGSKLIYQKGKRQAFVDLNLAVPEKLIKSAKEISQEFSKTMEWDVSKRTMISIEMKDNNSLDQFSMLQLDLVNRLKQLLKSLYLNEEYSVHKDRIATNIMKKKANKAYATNQVLNWLKEKDIRPENFVAFGDSISDLAIGEAIHFTGKPIKFIFVGENADLNEHNFHFPVVVTKNRCEEGTLEFLKNN